MTIEALFTLLNYREPLWFLLIFVPLLSQLYKFFIGNKLLPVKYFDPKMSYWYLNHDIAYKYSQRKLIVLDYFFWIVFSIALAGPEFAEKTPTFTDQGGDNILVLLDTSASMNTADHKPSRLQRARSELYLLVNKLKQGDKLGLMLYAGVPHLLFPPTSDKDVVHFYLDKIKNDMLPTAGSDIKAALNQANAFMSDKYSSRNNYILLISDGDIDNPDQSISAIKSLKLNIPVYTLGLGKKINAPIPSLDQHVKWSELNNQPLISNRNDDFLKSISEITGGKYVVISDTESDLDFLYRNGIKSETYTIKDRENTNWIQMYHLFLLFAALILFYKRILATGH